MSWQAMEAVQDHSKLNQQEQWSGLLIMLAIARYCNADGVTGWKGKPTSPSMESIAEKAHVTKRTVLNWIPKLEAFGELTVERNGQGRGAWNAYTINLPIGETNGERIDSPLTNNGESNGETNGEPESNNGESQSSPLTLNDLAEMVKQTQLMVKEMVKNGEPQSSPDTEIDTDKTDTDLKAAAAARPDYIVVYENNIGLVTPIVSKGMETAVKAYSEQWVIDAIVEAATKGGRSWKYIQTILDRWGVEGRGKPARNGTAPPPMDMGKMLQELGIHD